MDAGDLLFSVNEIEEMYKYHIRIKRMIDATQDITGLESLNFDESLRNYAQGVLDGDIEDDGYPPHRMGVNLGPRG